MIDMDKNITSVIVIALLLSSGLLLEYKFEFDYNTFYSDGRIAAREDWYVEYQRTYFRLDKYIPKAVVCDRYTATRCYPAEPYWQRLNRVLSKIYLNEEKTEFGTLVTKSTKYKDGSIRYDEIFTKDKPTIEEFPTSYLVNYDVGNKNRNYRLTWRIKNLNVKRYTEDLEIRNLCKMGFGFNITVDWCNEKEYFDYAELDISKRTLLVHFLPFKGDKTYSVRLFDPMTTISINANSDDAWQTNTDSVTDDNKVVIGNAYGNNYYGGYRFNNVGIPNGATINLAKIQLDYNYQSGSSTAIDIYGEDIDNAPTFSTGDNDNITTRVKTGNVTNWASPHSSGTGNTSDIKTVVQEIVDRTGWESGNSMAVLFYPASGNSDEWESISYNDGGTIKLYIDYSITDDDAPLWQNQDDNESGSISNKATINLSVQGKDLVSLSEMKLATNESGSWKNKTCNIIWEDHDFWANYAPYEIYRNITDTLINEGMPQMLGIITNDTNGNEITDDNTLVNYLNSIKGNSTVEFCLHSDIVDEWEGYNEDEARAKIERDNKIMWDTFGINATSFVPAGGGYNNSAMNAFVDNEWSNFTRFSTYDYEDLNDWEYYPAGLYHVPISTEFIDWGYSSMYSASAIEADCQTALDDTGTCNLVLHFNTFKNAGDNNLNLTRYQILLDVIDWVKTKDCNWYDVNGTDDIVHALVAKEYSGTSWNWANWTWKNDTVADATVGWKVYLEDGNGNINVTDIATFGVGSQAGDDTDPVVTISNPTNGTYHNTAPTISGTWVESYKDTCVTNSSAYSGTSSAFSFSNTSALSNQRYDILVTCNDTSSNTGTNLVYFTYDGTAPSVTVNYPLSGYFNVPPVINGTCTESQTSISKIWTNLSSYSTLDSTSPFNFTNTTSLTDGVYSFLVSCNDSAGNIGTDTGLFNLDDTNPSISYISPTLPSGNTVAVNHYTINTSISDDNYVSGLVDWNYSLNLWYRFDNSTDLLDHSSYGSDIVNHGSVYTDLGKFGGGREFDGVSTYFSIPDTYNDYKNMSYSFWLKRNVYSGDRTAKFGAMYVFQNNTGGVFTTHYPGYPASGKTSITTIDEWTHFAIITDNTSTYNVKIYKNGVKEVDTDFPVGKDVSSAGTIGQSDSVCHWNGSIDELRIWIGTIITEEEINASYNAGLYRLYNNFTDLIETSYDYTVYAVDEAGNVNSAGTRNITYDSGSCTSHLDCTNQFCAYDGVCTNYYSDLANCEDKEYSGLADDTVCIGNTTGWCYADGWDSTGEFCTDVATECVHNGASYSTTYELCSGNAWYKECLSGVWQSQVDCNTSDYQCDPGSEDVNCGYKLADVCTDGTGCVPNSCVDCGYYYSTDAGDGCEASTAENCDVACGAPYDNDTCVSPNTLNNDCSCTTSGSIVDTIYPNPARKGTEGMFDPPNPVDDFSGTIFTSAEYTAIGTSDDSRVTLYGVDSQNPFNKLNFSLPSYDSVNRITFTFEASSDGAPTRYFFIWDYNTNLWDGVYNEYAGSADNTTTFTITSGWSDYISNNQINYMVEDDCNYCDLYTDFAKIDFNYTSTTSLPSYSDPSTNGTLVSTHVYHKLKWTDSDGLDSSIFSFDNGVGSFTNDTAVSLTGTTDWTNVTKVLTSVPDATIRWKVYANDTIGNMRTTQTYQYVTTEPGAFAVNVTHILFNKTPGSWYKVGAFELDTAYVWLDCPFDGEATCYDNFEIDVDRMVKYGGYEETWIMVENGNYISGDGSTNILAGFWDIAEWADTYNTANPNANVKIHFRTHGYPSTVDYSIQSVRDNIVEDCWKALTGDGGTYYEYDGIFVNIEPVPNDDQDKVALLEEIRDNMTGLSDKKLGNDALPIDDVPNPDLWRWNVAYAHQLEEICNYTGAMLYWTSDDPLQGTYWKHRQWYQDQMAFYIEACEGIENHQLLFGMANSPSAPSHDQNVENITTVTEAMYLYTSETLLPKLDGIRIFTDEYFGHTSVYEYEWLLMKANYSYDENIKVKAFLRESATTVTVSIIDSDDWSYKVTEQSMSLNATSGFYEADIANFPTTDSTGNYTVRIHVVKPSGSGYQDSHKDALYIEGTEVALTVNSPTNTTYYTKTTWFNVTLADDGDTCRYNLDSIGYVTMSNDTSTHFYGSNTSMSHDGHYVFIICNDSNGFENDGEVWFTVDLSPTSNSPGDASYSLDSSHTIGWILSTPDSEGYYKVYRDSVLQNDSTSWTKDTNLNIWVNTSTTGNHNYTITFNDSVGRAGVQDEVTIIITGGNDGTPCTLDAECTSGYCDNDGVYATDDDWCFTPYNTYFDGQETPYCEYSTGVGLDECDELAVGTDLDKCVGITYYEQECSSTCGSVDVISVYECTDSGCSCNEPLCDGKAGGDNIDKCGNNFGFFADMCGFFSFGQDRGDNICRDSTYFSDCTGNSNCNGLSIRTGLAKCIGISYYEDSCSIRCELEDITTTFECTDTDCSCTESGCDEHTVGFDLDKCVGISYYEEECNSTAGLQDITSRFECTESGCSCSDVQCDGLTVNSMITNCTAEQTYLQDKCSATADTKDSNICRSSGFHSSCTGDVECNGQTVSTGDCDSTCSYTGGTGGDITIYLNGSPNNRYYEHGSNMNITAISSTGAYMCLDIPMVGYGDDYICGSSSITALIDAFSSSDEFNITTPATITSNTTLYIEHRKFDEIEFCYLGLDGTSVSDISIDVGNDGSIEHSYPYSELNNNLFEIDKLSTGVTSKNLTFKTAGTEIVYVTLPKDYTFDGFTFDLTGFEYLVEEESNFYTGTNFKVWSIDGTIWAVDLEITSDIVSGTTLTFPHGFVEEGNNVHPVKIYNITSIESEDSPIIVTGVIIGGSNLEQSSNKSESDWVLSSDLDSGDKYRVLFGKNVTWSNSTDTIEIAVNDTDTISYAILNVYPTHSQQESTFEQYSCSLTTTCYQTNQECADAGYGCPCYWYNTDKICDSDPSGDIYSTLGCTGEFYAYNCPYGTRGSYPRGTVLLSYEIEDINSVSYLSLNYHFYNGWTKYYSYFYNVASSIYEIILASIGGTKYGHYYIDTSYYEATDYKNGNYFNVKMWFEVGVDDYIGRFWEPTVYYNRSVYNPSLEIGSSTVWSDSGVLIDSTTSDNIYEYLSGDDLLKFSTGGSYGEIIVYFTPFWTSSPSNVTIKIGNSDTNDYTNTTVFNTSETITIESTNVDEYMDECTSITCDLPIYITTKTQGVLEISNIDLTYSLIDNKIQLNNVALNNYLDRDGAVTEVFIPIKITGVFGSLEVSVNDTYYGFDPTEITAFELGNSSNNDTATATIVFSNYSIDYPTGIEYWEIFPFSKVQTGLIPFGGNPIFLTNMLGDSSAPVIDLYIRLNESLSCATIYGTSTTGANIMLSTSDQIVCNDVTYSGTCNISNTVNLACSSYADAYIEPVFIFTGKCNGC
jgi:hypothetical protein